MIESDLIDAINSAPDDRAPQLVYADWLDDQADPRAEAWRVLIEAGKRPDACGLGFSWYYNAGFGSGRHCQLWDVIDLLDIMECLPQNEKTQDTFHAAMDAAAIAWVRHIRDENYGKEVCPYK